MEKILREARKGDRYRTVTGKKMEVTSFIREDGEMKYRLRDERGRIWTYNEDGTTKKTGFDAMKLYEKTN